MEDGSQFISWPLDNPQGNARDGPQGAWHILDNAAGVDTDVPIP